MRELYLARRHADLFEQLRFIAQGGAGDVRVDGGQLLDNVRNACRKMPSPRTALIILDMISEFRFPLGRLLAKRAMRTAREIATMKRRARRARLRARQPILFR